MNIIFLGILACIIGGIYHNFYKNFLETKIKNEVIIYLLWTLIILLFYLIKRIENFYIICLISTIAQILFVNLFYNGIYKKKNILTLTVGLLTVAIAIIVRHISFIINISLINNIELYMIIVGFFMMCLLKMMSYIFKKDDKYYQNKNLLLLLAILGSILLLDTDLLLNTKIFSIKLHIVSISSTILLLIVFCFLIYFYFSIVDAVDKIKELAIIENQINLYKDYIKDYESMEERRREIRHDMKKHLIMMENLVDHQEYNKLKEYIRKLTGSKYIKESIVTGNLSIDAVLNHYKWRISNLNIKFTYELKIPSNLNIDEMEIGIILGNLLDNSIEALEKNYVNLIDKKIFLSIKFISGTLVIIIKNPYNKNRIITDKYGDIKTNKKENENHGIGLKTVKKIVSNYNGEINIAMDEYFEVKILLYLNE